LRNTSIFIYHLFISSRAIIIKARIISRPIESEIIIGDNTHHQDQLMYPVSLRPINRTVKRPEKLIPLEDEEEELLDID
jgi:hypothetical protein